MRAAVFCLIFLFAEASVASEKWWQAYFTHPAASSGTTAVTPEPALVSAIKNTKSSFYAAFYDLNSNPVTEALIAAKKRGVDVKLVTDDSRYKNKQISDIERSGIKVVTDNRRELMHNKFAVIDNEKVWTGSYNITQNGEHRNNNNALLITSPELASIYLAEFTEMFTMKIFGNKKSSSPFGGLTDKHYVKIGNTDINAYFAPEDNIERIIISRIEKAKTSVKFMSFSFTSKGIGEAMIKKFNQGVPVYGLFEGRDTKSADSQYMKMKVTGIPVKTDSNRYAMHHKVIIIDDKRLITGSYNFSKNAARRNDENCIMIDNDEIASLYVKEFNTLYKAGR